MEEVYFWIRNAGGKKESIAFLLCLKYLSRHSWPATVDNGMSDGMHPCCKPTELLFITVAKGKGLVQIPPPKKKCPMQGTTNQWNGFLLKPTQNLEVKKGLKLLAFSCCTVSSSSTTPHVMLKPLKEDPTCQRTQGWTFSSFDRVSNHWPFSFGSGFSLGFSFPFSLSGSVLWLVWQTKGTLWAGFEPD